MDHTRLPDWETDLVDDAIRMAEDRRQREAARARRRALQLAREQAYHRLAREIDRPPAHCAAPPGQLSFFPDPDLTLFDEAG
ncbi:MAG TPA: hypothetical protein VE975_03145 [Actinomycetota bacterium]|jgi:hypothetical protein|nr:hypothetical protein [Actinomycetota bacterium]